MAKPNQLDPWSDVAPAAVLVVLAVCDVTIGSDWRGPIAVNVVVVPLAALALAWRRTQPLAVLAVTMLAMASLSVAYGGSQTWSSIVITVLAVYAAMTYGSQLLLSGVIAAAAVAIHDLSDPSLHGFGDAIWSSTLLVFCIGAGLTGRAVRRSQEALDDRAESLEREETVRAAAAAATERRRIAAELHDIVAHGLGVVVLQAGAAARVMDRDPDRARDVLDSIAATGREAIGEMATLLNLLDEVPREAREPRVSLGTMEPLVEGLRGAGITVEVGVTGDRGDLPVALDVSGYRIVQEALTNVAKHAHATRASVQVTYSPDELRVRVVDDGIGGRHGPGGRRGLAGMRERVAVFGGRLDAGPEPSGGWALTATLPVARP